NVWNVGTFSTEACPQGNKELRRIQRKIRCVYRPNTPSDCISCFSNGIRCASQAERERIAATTHARMNLSERVAQLEKQLAALHTHSEVETCKNLSLDGAAATRGSPTEHVKNYGLSTGLSRPLSAVSPTAANSLPILSLFDNAVLTTSESDHTISNSISKELGTASHRSSNYQSTSHFQFSRIKRASICEALTDALPSQSAMCEILEVGGLYWDLLRTLHPYMCCEDNAMSIQSYVLLALDQDNPCILGSALSWLAMSMQCIPTSYDSDHLGLPLPLNDLAQRYVATIDRLIICDDDISVSLEGIECILLQGQFYGNVGRPRKAWTINRKALSHAILLGLHKTTLQDSETSSPHSQRRESVWWHLIECDAYLSLMLGLQSFATPPRSGSWIERLTDSGAISCDLYRKSLFTVLGRISDRNQAMQGSSNATLTATMGLDRELNALSIHLQPVSWDSLIPSQAHSMKDGLALYESLITHFWHYQARAYLHLPLMLRVPSSGEFDYNRTACISGSREVVRVYIRMREFADGRINLCRLVDFQVFMAAVIVGLGHLGYGPVSAPKDVIQEMEDWSLVYQTMGILKSVSAEPDNLVAAQCFEALDALVSIAHSQNSPSGEVPRHKIFIPYFGTIKIAPASSFVKTTAQHQHLQEVDLPVATNWEGSNYINIDVIDAFSCGNGVQDSNSFPQSGSVNHILLPDVLAMDIDQDWSWMLNNDFTTNGHIYASSIETPRDSDQHERNGDDH
ncbi:hypothetical protein LTR01_003549, partial [Friedmanniomyces endolithicus]